jgi:hypothetical protein
VRPRHERTSIRDPVVVEHAREMFVALAKAAGILVGL